MITPGWHVVPFGSLPHPGVFLPLVEAEVAAGFPSPADDYREGTFDLNEIMVRNPPATYLIRARGESMNGSAAAILDGDYLVVDRSLTPRDGQIIIACLDGENTVKRLRRCSGRVTLEPENSRYPAIEVSPEREFTVWGVVVGRFRLYQ